jgi:hypothetical protein
MKEKVVISLFDLTTNMVKPWAEAGYLCYCVDLQHATGHGRASGRKHRTSGSRRSGLVASLIHGLTRGELREGRGSADLHYLVVEDSLLEPHETPDGRGLLVRNGDRLELLAKSGGEEQLIFLQRIAAKKTWDDELKGHTGSRLPNQN